MFKSIAVTYNNNPEINDLWVNSSFMCFCTEIWFWCYSIFFHWERWLQKYNDQWQIKERPIQEDQSNLYCQCAHCVEIFRKPCQNNLIGVCYPCVNCKTSNPTSFVKIHPKKEKYGNIPTIFSNLHENTSIRFALKSLLRRIKLHNISIS